MKSMKDTSIFLSLILRHKPETVGISLDPYGWADVSQLIDGINATSKYSIDMKTLEEIVRTDSKQRYSFSPDKTRIRANQGHSVKVDVGLEQSEPPEILFHGTGEKYVSSILSQGLKPQSRLYVHLSKDTQTAVSVGSRHGKPCVFEVKAGDMHRRGYKFFISANGVWLTESVPPVFLKMIKK